MLSLRTLIRPSVLGPTLAAAAAIAGLAVWYANVRAPLPEAPSFDYASESPATDMSVRATSSDDKAPAPEGLTLKLTDAPYPTNPDDINWGYRHFAPDARFPVVSSDGTIVQLFMDEADFSGAPITTLVAWSKTGKRIANISIGGPGWSGNEDRLLKKANAFLARSTWESLDKHITSTRDDNDVQTVTLAQGATLVYDMYKGSLTRDGHSVRASFPSPGSSELGGCGDITGIVEAFGTDHLVVLVPSANLGGDSCFGSTNAELATVVALR